jgi:O-antigen/teichoic acid export membrane protein
LSSSLKKKSIIGFSWLLSGTIAEAFLKILIMAFLARLVTPREFGVIGAALIIVGFSKLFVQLGIGPAIIQRKDLQEKHLTTGLTISLFVGILFAIILFLSSSLLASFFGMEELVIVLKVLGGIFILESLSIVSHSLLQRELKFRIIAISSFLSHLIGYGVIGISLGFWNFGIWALIIAHMSQTLIFTVSIILAQNTSLKFKFNYSAFCELIYFGGGMTLARIANYLAGQGDNIVIGRTLGAVELGIYGRAYQFMVMPVNLIGTTLDKVLFAAMSKVQDNKKVLLFTYLNGISLISLISIPLSIILVFTAESIIYIFLGAAWLDAVVPFQILAAVMLFRMSYKMSDSLARAVGSVYKRALVQGIYAILVIFFSWVGHFWGLIGVSIGVYIAVFINYLLMAKLSLKILQAKWGVFLKAQQYGMRLGIIVLIICGLIYSALNGMEKNLVLSLFIYISINAIFVTFALYYFSRYFISNSLMEMLIKAGLPVRL